MAILTLVLKAVAQIQILAGLERQILGLKPSQHLTIHPMRNSVLRESQGFTVQPCTLISFSTTTTNQTYENSLMQEKTLPSQTTSLPWPSRCSQQTVLSRNTSSHLTGETRHSQSKMTSKDNLTKLKYLIKKTQSLNPTKVFRINQKRI